MELIDGSETSAIINQTPGNYLKGNLLYISSVRSYVGPQKYRTG